jgi:hypothetical protein
MKHGGPSIPPSYYVFITVVTLAPQSIKPNLSFREGGLLSTLAANTLDYASRGISFLPSRPRKERVSDTSEKRMSGRVSLGHATLAKEFILSFPLNQVAFLSDLLALIARSESKSPIIHQWSASPHHQRATASKASFTIIADTTRIKKRRTNPEPFNTASLVPRTEPSMVNQDPLSSWSPTMLLHSITKCVFRKKLRRFCLFVRVSV